MRRLHRSENLQAVGRVLLHRRNLADRAVQFACVRKIDRFDRGNRTAHNLIVAHLHVQPGLRQNHEFRARVVAFDIGGGIGFGESEPLRVFQRR